MWVWDQVGGQDCSTIIFTWVLGANITQVEAIPFNINYWTKNADYTNNS